MTQTGPSLKRVIQKAAGEVAAMTGRRIDSVTGVRRRDEGWQLSFEVVELERIPASTSVLASYDAVVDDEGALLEFERTRRYYRNQPSEDD